MNGFGLDRPERQVLSQELRSENLFGPPLGKYIYSKYTIIYDSMSDLGEIRVYQRADFQSGSRVLKKVF